ncbi:MAG TPA: sulfatase [Vicinamibacteria bacterium]|nr:sulfatase [Vicinamibacteria bacterium]
MGKGRRWVLVGCVGAAALASCGRQGRRAEPNLPTPLVLVSLDTLRADRLNCYGYAARTLSPHIDALARDGILFENHISAAPWTIPAHVSLLTSLWPSNHGVIGSLGELREDEDAYPVLSESRTTLAEVLSAHGYTTAAFTAGNTLDARFGYGQGFSLYRTSMLKLHAGNMGEMLQWVAANASRPFFLFWHTFEPHAPYLGTAFLSDALPPERVGPVREAVERYADRLRKEEVHAGRFEPLLARRGAFNREVSEALYLGAVAEADRWVGVLVEELRRLDLYDRSLIVFTSDHGEEFADRSPRSFYNAHGHTLWREMVRVPLILKLPGQERAGTRVAALSRGVDVMPTALDVLRLPGSPQMQGESVRPLWAARRPASRVAFVEASEAAYEQKAVQSDRHKYLVRIGPESVARFGRTHVPEVPEWRGLYDLVEDSGETVNLLEGRVRPEHERLAERMDGALRRHLAAQRPDSQPKQLGPEMIERLRALGYVQ